MRSTSRLGASTAAFLIPLAGLLGACVTDAEPDVENSDPVAQTDPVNSRAETDMGPAKKGPTARAISPSLITVTWKPNTESDLAGYKVYRGGGPIPIALVQSNITTYYDRDIMPAKAYAYNITAFDIAGNESGFSLTAIATTPPAPMAPLSFSRDVFPILQSQCSSCHAAYAAADTAYTKLASLGSGPCAGRRIVIPGNASGSLVFQKATSSADCGDPMPSGPLSSEQAQKIGAWINQGGLNN